MNSDKTIHAFPIDTPAFSQEYLDYEIPDFRAVIRQSIPISILPNEDRTDFQIGDQNITAPDIFHRSVNVALTARMKFVCYDSVSFHQAILRFMGDDSNFRNTVWRLTDDHALWDVGLLEQRIAWAIEGRAIDYPTLDSLFSQYQVALSHEGLVDLLLAQFNRLIAELPILKNDVVGRMIFANAPPESPYIDSPERILARRFHYKERLPLFIHLIKGWQKYGPACIGLDVQGTIAAYYLSQKNLRFTRESQRLSGRKDEKRRRITRDDELRSWYEGDANGVQSDGSPRYSSAAPEGFK